MKKGIIIPKRSYRERYDFTRHPERIRSSDTIEGVFENILLFDSPDPSLIAGQGTIGGVNCVFLGQEKRRKGKESLATGMITSSGFAYALETLEFAEKNKFPVISFIDTFGGDSSMSSELGGQSFLISDCISKYCGLETFSISYVIGEGGSGGALALQIADKSFMLENSLYSVIAPESCSRIIFHKRLAGGEPLEDTLKDSLDMLRPGAEHIKEIGMIDGILPEPIEGAHTDYAATIKVIKESIIKTLKECDFVKIDEKKVVNKKSIGKLLKERRHKVLSYGIFIDSLDKITKRKVKSLAHYDINIIDIEREDFYTHLLMKANLKEEYQEETEFYNCLKEWDKDKNIFKVKGGCGFVPLKQFVENFYSCPICGKGEYLTVEEHINKICDKDTFLEIESDLTIRKLVGFEKYFFGSYKNSLEKLEENSFSKEALVSGTAKINGMNVVVAISDLSFFGGSFGAAFGEKFKRTVDYAVKKKYPMISICSSGGARMNEGPMSLAQMAKMNMALLDLKREGILFLSVITGPTTGGAYASYVTQGDIMFGEKGSLVEFAGPRVVLGAGLEVDKEIVNTDNLHETHKINHAVHRKELKNTLSLYIELYHGIKFPEIRKNKGRIQDFAKSS